MYCTGGLRSPDGSRINVAVLDLNLPGLDGVEALGTASSRDMTSDPLCRMSARIAGVAALVVNVLPQGLRRARAISRRELGDPLD
jgi:DNA-binding response OmpR family regulator